ncbi:LuxR family transcriptional regulator [Streptomyces sp. S.PB5]|uniref:helix-turn-helix transcriptional regulator n=1 Tax=Streptomyces sp. S.PB5 TaxID=3020844 RepID=UPI0025B13687|nr:LuxR family transcriptional regulator [Streptomyces sp. S.PB5]MDN3029655.1 AAA family ATPase [Streptomyces sp. S.PB5]
MDTPPSAHAPLPLFGRDRELRVIDGFLGRACREGASLFLAGQPGVGKTRLLTAAAERAAALGGRVLWGTGVQYRADVSYGALRTILLPLAAGFNRLPVHQREALMSALGLRTGPVPDRLVILNACLNLLRQEAESRPLVLVVDDLQWIDPPSATALGFVARRPAGSRLGLIAASRPWENDPFKRGGLARLQVRPLADEASDALVSTAFPAMAPRVRHRVVAESRGNPLALLELPGVLSTTQMSAIEALPDVLPLTGHIESAFAARIARLPDETRHTLLVLAQEGTGDLRVLQQAVPGEPVLDHLAAAERSKLVTVDLATRRVAFQHPLARSAVVDSCADADVRQVHHVLAQVFAYDPDRSAWHLAEAAAGADDRVAELLEQAAHRRLRRADTTGAMEALTRAAELSADDTERSRRLAETAYLAACVTGEPESAARLLAESRRIRADHGGSLHAAATEACLLLDGDQGDLEAAHAALVAAVERGDHGYRAARSDLVDALDMLMTVCWAAGREDFWPPLHEAVARLSPTPPEVLLLTSGTCPSPAGTSPDTRQRFARLIDRQEGERAPHHLVRINSSAIYLDLFDSCRSAAWRIIEDGRAGGAVASGLSTLAHLCLDDFGTGRWEEAEQLADEGLASAQARGYGFVGGAFPLLKALLAAARGEESADWWADEVTRLAEGRKAYGVARTAHHPRALAALGRDDHEAAYRHACAVSPAGTLEPGSPHAPWVALDLVEAAVRTGRTEQAAAHVRAMREALPELSPRLAMLTLAAQALVAPDQSAADLFERAVSTPGAHRWPFDHARVQLLYGEWLRRARALGEARAQLTTALGALRRLGATPWANRAAGELRASGRSGSAETGGGMGLAALTPQELEIASLAAEGLTNKQIGAKLYLSPRTVGTHLYRIFPKLGITSRASLRDALSR